MKIRYFSLFVDRGLNLRVAVRSLPSNARFDDGNDGGLTTFVTGKSTFC